MTDRECTHAAELLAIVNRALVDLVDILNGLKSVDLDALNGRQGVNLETAICAAEAAIAQVVEESR